MNTPADNLLLHPENFQRMTLSGRRISRWMQDHATEVAHASQGLADPDVSILIRSRNDADHLQRLLTDIADQVFTGKIEIILVDTESRDNTVQLAKKYGAKIVPMTQATFSYPKALNAGFAAASHPWVVTLVGHSSLTNKYFLKSLAYWLAQKPDLCGIYSLPLANWNASRWERLESALAPRIWEKPVIITDMGMGIMAANCSILKRDAWEELGGYDERWAGGGEDRAFARTMLEHHMTIVREPLCSVFHSHALSMGNTVKQWLHWGEVAKKPTEFMTKTVHGRRPDLR